MAAGGGVSVSYAVLWALALKLVILGRSWALLASFSLPSSPECGSQQKGGWLVTTAQLEALLLKAGTLNRALTSILIVSFKEKLAKACWVRWES